MKRLRVMHVVFSLETGGQENGIVNLCNGLCADEFIPSVCVFRGGGALEKRLNTDRVELQVLKRHWNNDPSLPFRFAASLRKRQIDILHTHSWGTLIEGVIAARLARTPVIVHGEHGLVEERPHQIALQRRFWAAAQQVTAVAEPLADRMSRAVGFARDRIQVIANGVDTTRFRPLNDQSRCRQQMGLPNSGLLFGTVARLDPVKNHLGVLQALAQLRADGIHAHLAFAGDGPMKEDLGRAARELDLMDQIWFLGQVDHIETFLNALDVFVLNSHTEGMSNTVIEAMACAVPVVATSVGANPTLIVNRESGCLVPANHVADLADALARLAGSESLRKALGNSGRQRISTLYGMESMVQEYSNLYHRLAAIHLRRKYPYRRFKSHTHTDLVSPARSD